MSVFKAAALAAMLGCCALSSAVQAEWSGGVEGGTERDDAGNSSTRLRLQVSNNVRPLTHFLYADWVDSQQDNYEFGYLPRFWFTERFYALGDLRFNIDKAANIERRSRLLGGLGYRVFSTAERTLWAEVAAGRRKTAFVIDGLKDKEEGIGLVRAGGSQLLAELLRFELGAEVLQGNDLRETNITAGLALKVPGGAIRLSLRRERLTPDEGPSVENDTRSIGFVYGF